MSNHEFKVTPTVSGTSVKWELCYLETGQCGDGTPTKPYPEVVLDKDSGAAHFKFTITGTSGITFAPNSTGPVWVHEKGTGSGPGVHQQIPKKEVKGAGSTQLTMKDKNSRPNDIHPNPITLKYQLNFVDAQGQPVSSIDPDIKNGGKTFFATNAAIAAAIGTALAIIVLVAWWSRVRAQKRTPVERPAGSGADQGR